MLFKALPQTGLPAHRDQRRSQAPYVMWEAPSLGTLAVVALVRTHIV